jgi:hypothetical protein
MDRRKFVRTGLFSGVALATVTNLAAGTPREIIDTAACF